VYTDELSRAIMLTHREVDEESEGRDAEGVTLLRSPTPVVVWRVVVVHGVAPGGVNLLFSDIRPLTATAAAAAIGIVAVAAGATTARAAISAKAPGLLQLGVSFAAPSTAAAAVAAVHAVAAAVAAVGKEAVDRCCGWNVFAYLVALY